MSNHHALQCGSQAFESFTSMPPQISITSAAKAIHDCPFSAASEAPGYMFDSQTLPPILDTPGFPTEPQAYLNCGTGVLRPSEDDIERPKNGEPGGLQPLSQPFDRLCRVVRA